MEEKCTQCDKVIDTDNDSHIYVADHTAERPEVLTFVESVFCSWKCVKLWAGGK